MINYSKPTINLKCVPVDKNWPGDKAMTTPWHGAFYPGEVKQVADDGHAKDLIRSGEFEVTEEEPNTEEIHAQVAEAKASTAEATPLPGEIEEE